MTEVKCISNRELKASIVIIYDEVPGRLMKGISNRELKALADPAALAAVAPRISNRELKGRAGLVLDSAPCTCEASQIEN